MNTTPFSRVRVALALVAAFALTVTITFGARRVLSRPLDAQPSDADLKSARETTKAAIPRLPKDTEEKLAAALYPEIPPASDIVDPFVDRAGVTSTTSTKASAAVPTLTTAGLVDPQLPDRNARLSQWQQSVRSAVAAGLTTPPMSTAYLISEVAPTGKSEMSGRRSVFLYIDSEKRTLTVDIGAKFFDGVLVGVNSEGAQFRTSLGHTKLVPWIKKDDFTNSSIPALPSSLDVNGPRQQTVTPAKPVSQLPRPKQDDRSTDRYADLQEAVKERYPATATSVASPRVQESKSTAPLNSAPVQLTPVLPIIIPFSETITQPNDQLSESNFDRQEFNHAIKPIADASPSPSASPAPSATPSASPEPPAAAANPAATPTPSSSAVVAAVVPKAIAPKSAPEEKRNPVCDLNYRGERISISNESDRPLSFLALVNQLNKAYGANIVLDYDIQETPVRLTVTDTPWTSVLRTLLDLNDLDTVCLDGGILQIAKRAKIAQIGDQRRKSAPIVREVFKLRYLQPTAGARANLAGQTQATNGANIQTLEDAIREILKAGGDSRGEARRVPGHNEIFVAATQQQMDEIRDLIARVDRPGYQVKISALVYTANENRLRDIGSQLSIAAFNAPNINIGGFTTLPNTSNNGSGTGAGTGTGSNNGQGVAGRNPGGIPGLATGMRQPSNGLGAGSPLATFGGSVLFNSFQFAYQLTLAQNQGAVNIQSRPFGIVSDGDTFDLVAGTQIPVVTTTIAGGAPFQSGSVQFIEASRIARITPQVAENEEGQPNYVTLNIQLENNSVDTSLGTFNGVPGVNRQSLQTVLRLRNGETVVIGGLTADQISNAKSKVPGLGDIPLLGNAFKKKQNQENRDRLYFAITAEVIPQEAPMPSFQLPADATTTQPLPPLPQTPSSLQQRKP